MSPSGAWTGVALGAGKSPSGLLKYHAKILSPIDSSGSGPG